MTDDLSDLKPAELLLATALIWKLLTDELCARDEVARKSLIASLDNMIGLMRSGPVSNLGGVAAAMTLFRTVLTEDVASALALLENLAKPPSKRVN